MNKNSLMQRQRLLQEALNYCQHNQFNEAKAIYLDLIKTLPNHPQVLTNLGTIEIQFGFVQDGIDLLKKSLKIDPWQSHAISNLGNALLELNQHKEAIEFFDKAISISPKSAETYYNKGRALRELEDFESAISYYSKAIELNPNHFLAFNNRGFIFNLLGRYELAIDDFNRAIAINPNFAEPYTNKGVSLNSIKRYEEAIISYDIAIQINPKYAEAHTKRGVALNALQEYQAAIDAFNKAILYDMNAVEAYNGLGLSFYYLRDYDKASSNYDKALDLNPNFYEAIVNKGIIFFQKKLYEEALDLCEKGIVLKPNKPELFVNKAQIYIELKKYELAFNEFNQAITRKPDYAEAYYNAALLYLNIKKFEKGWNYYEKRIDTEQYKGNINFKEKELELNELKILNKTVLIHNEQGLGDQILYLNLIRELDGKNNKIIALVNSRLISLFSRSCPDIDFRPKEMEVDSIQYDYHLLSASLGKFLRKSEKDFSKLASPYLKSDETLTTRLREKVANKNKIACGIAWKSKNENVGSEKSLKLEDFLPLLKLQRINFIDLQYGDTEEDKNLILKKYNIKIEKINEIDNFNDIDGLASLIDACDFIVTTSNVTAHIAGALAKDVYLIVPDTRGKIWYWHEGDKKSLWYPTVNQFNISKDHDINFIMNEIAEKIKGKYL